MFNKTHTNVSLLKDSTPTDNIMKAPNNTDEEKDLRVPAMIRTIMKMTAVDNGVVDSSSNYKPEKRIQKMKITERYYNDNPELAQEKMTDMDTIAQQYEYKPSKYTSLGDGTMFMSKPDEREEQKINYLQVQRKPYI